MKLLPIFGLSALALCVPAQAQLEGQGFELARKSGATIGAATACGLASDRALATGKRVMELVTAGPNASLDQQLRNAHVEAVGAADQLQQTKNRPGCKSALRQFRLLEDAMTIRR